MLNSGQKETGINYVKLDNIPEELKKFKQWVAWKSVHKGVGKATKIPVNPITGLYASTDKPETWSAYDDAVTYYNTHKDNGIAGIGFVFTKDDPFCGIDLDDCYDPETSEMKDWASKILKDLSSYCEISPSVTGVKIFTKGILPGAGRNFGDIEMYDTKRFFTLTGYRLNRYSSEIEDRNSKVVRLYNKLSDEKQKVVPKTTEPSIENGIDIDSLPIAYGTKKLIKEGEAQGDRSEAIMSVINALVGTGLSEPEIITIFDNHPIGEKYREKGSSKVNWLKGEIERSREYIKKNSKGVQKVSQEAVSEAIDEVALAQRAKGILDSKEPCDSFDTSKLPRVLQDYIQGICATTEAEPMVVTQSVLCTLSSLMKKSCFIPEGRYFQKLYPNLWALTIAPSGDFKTTALNKGARIAWQQEREIKERLKEYEGDNSDVSAELQKEIRKTSVILPNRATAEGLLTHLSDECGGMVICSEFGEWLQNLGRSHNQGLKALLTDLYDVPFQYSYKTSTKGHLIVNEPFITINGVSTMAWVKENLKISDVSSGFFARFLLFYPPHKKYIPPALPVYIPQDHTTEDGIKVILGGILPERAWLLSSEGKRSFESIHQGLYKGMGRQDEKTKEFLSPYLKRWSPYILKIAMILQPFINSNTIEIGEQAIIGANSIVEYAIKSTIFIFQNELGETAHQTKQRKILEYIAKRGGKVKRSVLQKSKVLGGGTTDYDYVCESLETTGDIVIKKPGERKAEWKYVLTT